MINKSNKENPIIAYHLSETTKDMPTQWSQLHTTNNLLDGLGLQLAFMI